MSPLGRFGSSVTLEAATTVVSTLPRAAPLLAILAAAAQVRAVAFPCRFGSAEGPPPRVELHREGALLSAAGAAAWGGSGAVAAPVLGGGGGGAARAAQRR